jgi:endoglucanase
MMIFRSALLALLALLSAAGSAPARELLHNRGFIDGSDGWWSVGADPDLFDVGALCLEIPAGTERPWSVMLGQNDLALAPGRVHRLRFTIAASRPTRFSAIVQGAEAPWSEIGSTTGVTSAFPVAYVQTLRAPETGAPTQLVFQLGGGEEPARLCLSSISLVELDLSEPAGLPAIRVNQLGYMADGPKRATLVSSSPEPIEITLKNAVGQPLWRGLSQPLGHDPSAGLDVHGIDFSEVGEEGSDLVLAAGADASFPFAIAGDLYSTLAADALRFFYLARSGIAIEARFAGPAYARPAGHLGAAGTSRVNQGDFAVPCQNESQAIEIYGEAWTCDYTLDVLGGWYDAGDHGKYVVNGGLAVAQLMAGYARAARVGDLRRLADGGLSIPESGNAIPDILDEARWQLDFLVSMMVPQGQPLAGMAHHKVHDTEWTFIPTLPSDDPMPRRLHRPSTAATLNLAAAAAQGARLFAPFDPAYAETLLLAARRAYSAAEANPALYASPIDGDNGGGPYDDDDVSDEFYWAAVELAITTREPYYLDQARASRHWAGPVFVAPIFDWRSVAGFARLQLAANLDALPQADAESVEASVIAGARAVRDQQRSQAFGHPYAPSNGRYGWGSNHLVIQNAILMAAAYDLTDEADFRSGALEAIDYILGRNAIARSYITGYGTRFSTNQHSRWLARQAEPRLPPPPPGTLAGGPNSGLDDPVAAAALSGCVPQACYLDDIESWSTNEVAINWNAALVQFSAWLADQ